ncbi:membrane-associated protein, putative [Bodo saltans]|uniref:Membrane-associated protein, putative n=1 Tax=Bodo saltans TaxID=75058 RepID=A0A0S4ITA1_BODSA|nr:membrane-associated protein, putative [Bodo saltans]|eukprot:CUG06454.1 membrane-associated protein, putative [Bodo saltans]
MVAFAIFAVIGLISETIALGLAMCKIVNPNFELDQINLDVDRGATHYRALMVVCKTLSAPVATVAATFCLALRPQLFQAVLPAVFGHYGAQLHKALPLHPKDILEAFQLGTAYRMLTHEGNLTSALDIGQQIAGRPVTEDELRRIPQLMHEHMNHQDIVQQVLAAFSIVNTIWLVAILGLLATVGPFLYALLKPLRGFLYHLSEVLLEYTIKIAKRLFPLSEMLLYTLSLYILVESSRYHHQLNHGVDAYGMTGAMTACTGVAVFGAAWAYTTVLNGKQQHSVDVEYFMTLTWILASLLCLPLAYLHQSHLFGYGVVVAASAALGFSAFSSGLCTMIGFESRDALIRGAVGCGSMTAVAFVIQTFGFHNGWTTPLVEPLSVMGTSVYLLALDIHAFLARDWRSRGFFIANLVVITVGSHFVGLAGSANVAKVFGSLFLFTVACEKFPRGEAFKVWIFVMFAVLYGISLYVSRNPELVVSVVSGGRL